MKRRALLASALLSALPGLAAEPARAQQADAATLAQIEAYLNSIRTLKAHFLQTAPDGRVSQGTVWLERPGRMRFAYDPPTPLLLVAGNGMLVFHDSQLGQTSNIPLSQTPLGILLADQVRLSGPVKVTSMQRLPGMITITVVRAASITDGSLTLVFADNPLTLRQWSVIDAQRQETRVTLSDVQLGGHFKDSLFDFIDRGFPNGTPLQGGGG
jgi:outer membrane lipoprotein-sorting protein